MSVRLLSDEAVAALRSMGPPPPSIFTRLYEAGHVFRENGGAFAIADAHPLSPGHHLVCPIRQVSGMERLTGSERNQLWALVAEVKAALQATRNGITGFRIMINEGAPQHIQHLHVHVIPWYDGMKP